MKVERRMNELNGIYREGNIINRSQKEIELE